MDLTPNTGCVGSTERIALHHPVGERVRIARGADHERHLLPGDQPERQIELRQRRLVGRALTDVVHHARRW